MQCICSCVCTRALNCVVVHTCVVQAQRVLTSLLLSLEFVPECRAGLQPLESLLTKAVQLYEMVNVRHGIMLVGSSFGMKTTTTKMLAGALDGVPGAHWAGVVGLRGVPVAHLGYTALQDALHIK